MKEPIEIADIREGDLIRWEHGESVHRWRARYDGESYLSSIGQHFLLERPTPPVKLPTEPGWYLTASSLDPVAVYLAADGYWTTPENFGQTGEDMAQYAPLTRLEPVPVTAAKVIARVRTIFGGPSALLNKDVDRIAAEFGVTDA